MKRETIESLEKQKLTNNDEKKQGGSYSINPSGGELRLCHGVSDDKYTYDKRNTTYTSIKNPSGLFFVGDSPEPSKIHSILLRPDDKLKGDESRFEPSLISKDMYDDDVGIYEYKTPERSQILLKSHMESVSQSENVVGSITSRSERDATPKRSTSSSSQIYKHHPKIIEV